MRFCLVFLVLGCCGSIARAQWEQQTIRTNADFRGLCVTSSEIAWVSGTKGTYGRTINGGKSWSVGTVPGAEKLDFRDVEAFDKDTAYLLSAGPGADSRIYKTADGGTTWSLQFRNAEPAAFFDAIAFWDREHGIALGDPVKRRFQLIVTNDGGTHWQLLSGKNLPQALPNEGAFAASGTCLVTYGSDDVWFATGGAKSARIFHSPDRGQQWTVNETPIIAGTESAGIFSIAFRDRNCGMIVGGDYRKPSEVGANAAVTDDGGRTWNLIDKPFPFRSAVAWAGDRWMAVGTSGSHCSADNGVTWQLLDRGNYNSVGFTRTGEGWATGPKGRIAKFIKTVAATKPIYPAHWWSAVSKVGAPNWEILPQEAGPGEVIRSRRHELGLLSNFASTPFTFRGQRYASLEGFWQMMLYPESPDDERAKFPGLKWANTREQVAQMTAFEAKNAGTLAEQNMKAMQIDWVTFEGKKMPYRSTEPGEHFRLIVAATWAKVQQNARVKEVLLATGDLKLKPDHHSEPNAPVAWRYYDILTDIRKQLRGATAEAKREH